MKKFFCVFCIMFILYVSCSCGVSQISNMPKETKMPKETNMTKETNMLDVENENAHEAYKTAMEKPNNYLNRDSENPYVYYDIDKDGIDELIVNGGYRAYGLFTYKNGEVIDLWSSKYGGDEILIYPDKVVVFFSSGHMDHYVDTYIQIFESKVKIAAEWYRRVKHLSETKSRTENEYTVMGVSAKKSEYEAYVKSLEKEKVVTHNQLEWRTMDLSGCVQ